MLGSETSASETALPSTSRKKHRFADVEYGVALAILRQGEDGLCRLHDLADFQMAFRDDARHTCAKLGVAEIIFRRSQLCIGGFKRALCASQLFLRLVKRNTRREAIGEQSILAVKRRLRDAQSEIRRDDSRACCVDIGLLFGRIDRGQQLASIDVRADIDETRDHPSADAKGELGLETGLQLAGQRYRTLMLLGAHDVGAHEFRWLCRTGGTVSATAERRHKCERQHNGRGCRPVLSG